MSKKPKFKPKVTRIKLNPEQAVLSCACWSGTAIAPGNIAGSFGPFCQAGLARNTGKYPSCNSVGGAAGS